MNRQRNFGIGIVFVLAVALVSFFSWQRPTVAQSSSLKLGGKISQTKAGFEPLLIKHGAKGMLLTIEIRVAGPHVDAVQVIGKLVQATDSFLLVKMQNERDLTFIPWEHVLHITGRPA